MVEFSEALSSEVKDKIYDEFNTLSVVYRQPAYSFVVTSSEGDGAEKVQEQAPARPAAMPDSNLLDTDSNLPASNGGSSVSVPPASTPQPNLLEANFIRQLQGLSIHCIASGGAAPQFKMYIYGQVSQH